MICPNCKKTEEQLQKEGKLKVVQGYAQCADCHGDLEHATVVRRIENHEIVRFECGDCGHDFAYHLAFVGKKPDMCPKCQSRDKLEEIHIEESEHVLVECVDCGYRECIEGKPEDGSLWAPNGHCPACKRRMYPIQIVDGELVVWDERRE
jgi:uncharacterized metal-binding protein (TIGR02443 family)